VLCMYGTNERALARATVHWTRSVRSMTEPSRTSCSSSSSSSMGCSSGCSGISASAPCSDCAHRSSALHQGPRSEGEGSLEKMMARFTSDSR
jgi:hypothetical protein